MGKKIKEIIIETIKKSKNILFVIHRNMDLDAVGSSIAFYLFLKNLGKDGVIVSPDDKLNKLFEFLPHSNLVSNNPKKKDFVIHISTKNTQLEHLKYKVENEQVKIIISPKDNGIFSQNDVSFESKSTNFDLIISLDCGSIDQMGKIYTDNQDLFSSLPLLNIDHHASNTMFGKINFVDSNASSTSEIISKLIFEDLDTEKKNINEDIATLLLAGIIGDTESFKNENTTQSSFDIAGDLVQLGAKKNEIIKQVYRTRKISMLRLWGIALSKLKSDEETKIIWTSLNRNDFTSANAEENDAGNVIDELLKTIKDTEVILFLRENENGDVKASLRTENKTIEADKIAGIFGGGGHKQAAGFTIEKKTIAEVEENIIKNIKEFQQKRLGMDLEPKKEKEKKEDLPIAQITPKIEEAKGELPGDIDDFKAEKKEIDRQKIDKKIEEKIPKENFQGVDKLEENVRLETKEEKVEFKAKEEKAKIFGDEKMMDSKKNNEIPDDSMDNLLKSEAKEEFKKEPKIEKKEREKFDDKVFITEKNDDSSFNFKNQNEVKKDKNDKNNDVEKFDLISNNKREEEIKKNKQANFTKENNTTVSVSTPTPASTPKENNTNSSTEKKSQKETEKVPQWLLNAKKEYKDG